MNHKLFLLVYLLNNVINKVSVVPPIPPPPISNDTLPILNNPGKHINFGPRVWGKRVH